MQRPHLFQGKPALAAKNVVHALTRTKHALQVGGGETALVKRKLDSGHGVGGRHWVVLGFVAVAHQHQQAKFRVVCRAHFGPLVKEASDAFEGAFVACVVLDKFNLDVLSGHAAGSSGLIDSRGVNLVVLGMDHTVLWYQRSRYTKTLLAAAPRIARP